MKDDLPEPLGRGISDINMFEELWNYAKKGIVLAVLLGGASFIVGVCWIFIGA